MSSDQSTPPRRRHAVSAPAIVGLVVAVVLVGGVVAVWGTGGFGTDAKPYLGTRVLQDETVETRFWNVAVHGAEVSLAKAEIRVAVTAMNKQRRTAVSLTTNMLVIRMPDGTPMLRSSCTSMRGYRFGPLIPTDAQCVFRFEDNELQLDEIPEPGPFDIEFIVLDQNMSDNFVTVPEPQAGEAAGWLPLTVRVAEEDA